MRTHFMEHNELHSQKPQRPEVHHFNDAIVSAIILAIIIALFMAYAWFTASNYYAPYTHDDDLQARSTLSNNDNRAQTALQNTPNTNSIPPAPVAGHQ